MLEVKNLKKSFGKVDVLKGIDLKIEKGDRIAIIGPSGCGKSTFLKTLNRMNDLVDGVKITGSIQYDGKEILIGIRPEDVHDEPAIVNASPNTVIESEIILHERVDVEMRLRFEYAGVRVSARVDLRTKNRTGDVVKFAFIEDKIHLFDNETEEAIGGKFNN